MASTRILSIRSHGKAAAVSRLPGTVSQFGTLPMLMGEALALLPFYYFCEIRVNGPHGAICWVSAEIVYTECYAYNH